LSLKAHCEHYLLAPSPGNLLRAAGPVWARGRVWRFLGSMEHHLSARERPPDLCLHRLAVVLLRGAAAAATVQVDMSARRGRRWAQMADFGPLSTCRAAPASASEWINESCTCRLFATNPSPSDFLARILYPPTFCHGSYSRRVLRLNLLTASLDPVRPRPLTYSIFKSCGTPLFKMWSDGFHPMPAVVAKLKGPITCQPFARFPSRLAEGAVPCSITWP
jgi:hypothetical protein